MEDGLVQPFGTGTSGCLRDIVLILIVVEDGLVLTEDAWKQMQSRVLILIVVEDGLVQR